MALTLTDLGGTQNKAWAENKSGFGFRMLMKMGWDVGKGLGRKEDGSVTHVRVESRTEQLGLGMEQDDRNRTWISAAQSYHELLVELNKAHGAQAQSGAASSAESGRSDDSADSDSEAVAAQRKRSKKSRAKALSGNADSEGARDKKASKKAKKESKKEGKSKKKQKEKGEEEEDRKARKKARKEKRKAKRAASDSDVDVPTPVSRPQHLYHKVMRSKNVAGYSAEDLKQILGLSHCLPPSATPTPSASIPATPAWPTPTPTPVVAAGKRKRAEAPASGTVSTAEALSSDDSVSGSTADTASTGMEKREGKRGRKDKAAKRRRVVAEGR